MQHILQFAIFLVLAAVQLTFAAVSTLIIINRLEPSMYAVPLGFIIDKDTKNITD